MPHTRPVTILGTESRPGLLLGDVAAGPEGVLRVPAAAISVLDLAATQAGIPAIGYYAQVPHYVTGAYPPASVELLRLVGRHVEAEIAMGELRDEARRMLARLDAATAGDANTRAYVERLEAMVDEARRPEGDDLISEIERFLRDRGDDDVPERATPPRPAGRSRGDRPPPTRTRSGRAGRTSRAGRRRAAP